MTNVLIVFDVAWDNIRIYSVSVYDDELELLKKVHNTYVNGDMGEVLTKQFCEFFYTEESNVQKRFKELVGYVDFLTHNNPTYLFVVGFL